MPLDARPGRWSGVGAVALAALGFGCISVLVKSAYEAGSSPTSLLSTRLVVAALILAPALLAPAWRSLGWRRLLRAAAGGAAFSVAGFLEFEGLARLSAPTLVVLLFLAPVWVAIGSRVVLGRRLGRPSVAMLAVVLLGVALLVGWRGEDRVDLAGVALGVAASLLYACVFLLLEDLVRGSGPVLATGLVCFAAALASLAVEPSGVEAELADPATGWYAASVGGLTAGSLLLLAAGLRTASAFTASVLTAVEPLAAAVLAWAFLGEVLTAAQMAGALAVVGGVVGVSVGSTRV
jgi:drug/metabolite transporter (DMT)-like permease